MWLATPESGSGFKRLKRLDLLPLRLKTISQESFSYMAWPQIGHEEPQHLGQDKDRWRRYLLRASRYTVLRYNLVITIEMIYALILAQNLYKVQSAVQMYKSWSTISDLWKSQLLRVLAELHFKPLEMFFFKINPMLPALSKCHIFLVRIQGTTPASIMRLTWRNLLAGL